MLDELSEGFWSGVGRALGYIFLEFLFNFVFYYIGYPIVKLLTLGKYPTKEASLFVQSETRQEYYASIVGLTVSIGTVVSYFIITNNKSVG